MNAPRMIVTYVAMPAACWIAFGGEFWKYMLLINTILIAIHLDRTAV